MQYAFAQLATVDDSLDNGDFPFTVTLVGSGYVNALQYTVKGTQYDDDSAGLAFLQNRQIFYAYRAVRRFSTFLMYRGPLIRSFSLPLVSFPISQGRNDGLDPTSDPRRTVPLPQNTTSESGAYVVSFSVALSSQPLYPVTVDFTTATVSVFVGCYCRGASYRDFITSAPPSNPNPHADQRHLGC